VNLAAHPVVASLTPVFLLIALGWIAGRRNWISDGGVKDLSNLVFLLLIPSLLFRTMSSVRFEQLDLRPIAAYFPAALLLLALSIAWRGFNRRSVVMALAGTFSNMVMIGITLVELAYGKAGLVTLLTLVSVHALILLTVGSVVLELTVAREARHQGGRQVNLAQTILCGLLYAQTGWGLPSVVDKPLQLLGSAFGPISLVLVGVTLAKTPLGHHLRAAALIVVSKNLVLPVLVGLSAWAMGITGLPLTVLVVAGALPIGANVFLFAQRYEVAQDLTTASMGLSTVAALFTLSAVMAVMGLIG